MDVVVTCRIGNGLGLSKDFVDTFVADFRTMTADKDFDPGDRLIRDCVPNNSTQVPSNMTNSYICSS